ncbi:MAG TPA: PASTA domain-containing protein [Patescibacteria group bacterium]|nr:PASTA domain-containing protein [Patescibacteria group bacterium]
MTDRPNRPFVRSAVTAVKILVVVGGLVVIAAVSAWLTVRRAVSGRDVQVPDLAGLTGPEAEKALRDQGLALDLTTERYDPRIPAGQVLSQEPSPGSRIKADRKVRVVVSLGEKGSSVPELRGSAARTAQIALQQQGYRVGDLLYAYSPRSEENLVIGQDPMPGGGGAKDARVSLLVSRGRRPATYVMPNLVGHPQQDALRWMAKAGLRPAPVRRDPRSTVAAGTIVAQRPEAGWPVRSGDLVTLTIAGEDSDHE